MKNTETTRNDDNFIMLPTVDFCFKELMQKPKVRQGFIAALLRVKPEEIQSTTLLPTFLQRNSEEDKLGILDVRVKLTDGTQMDLEMQVAYFAYWEKRVIFYLCKMYTEQLKKGESYSKLQKCIHVSILDFVHFPEDEEYYRTIKLRNDASGQLYSDVLEIQILELKKLPGKMPQEDVVTAWMQFFSGKTREEFESMAKENEYIAEAYDTLLELSADEKKRLEYEAREKALKDYNTQVESYWEAGEKRGIEIGEKRGIEIGEKRGEEKILCTMLDNGMSIGELAKFLNKDEAEIRRMLE